MSPGWYNKEGNETIETKLQPDNRTWIWVGQNSWKERGYIFLIISAALFDKVLYLKWERETERERRKVNKERERGGKVEGKINKESEREKKKAKEVESERRKIIRDIKS